MHAEVRFGFVGAGGSRHSQCKDSSRRAQAERTCRVPAGQGSRMTREHQQKRWPLQRKKVVPAPVHGHVVVVATEIVGAVLQ